MRDASYLAWPFFEPRHAELAERIDNWAQANIAPSRDHEDADSTCRKLVSALGRDRILEFAIPPDGAFDLRSICLIRETLAFHSALADFAFAMQGLGTAPITLFGGDLQKDKWLGGARAGDSLTAFALSEMDAGSDVAAMATELSEMPNGLKLNGSKAWISNGGIAKQYVVFAKDGGRHTALIISRDLPGFSVEQRVDIVSPHPMGSLRFESCPIAPEAILGGRGNGLRVALGTLDVFRPSVGAAALGLAKRAMSESLSRATSRRMFGGVLGDLQLTQVKLADMALKIDVSELLIYRAAWARDVLKQSRITREAAMAKLFATEAAQQIIDDAVQIWGAAGVAVGSIVEHLYRDIRAMRIYEGASEVQQLVIARSLLTPPK